MVSAANVNRPFRLVISPYKPPRAALQGWPMGCTTSSGEGGPEPPDEAWGAFDALSNAP